MTTMESLDAAENIIRSSKKQRCQQYFSTCGGGMHTLDDPKLSFESTLKDFRSHYKKIEGIETYIC